MGKNKNGRQINPMSNTRTMAKEGMRIMKDIAFQKFNFFNDGHVFRNLEFVKATIDELNKRITDLNIHIYALNCTYPNSQDPVVRNLLYRDCRKRDAYVLMNQTLYDIYMSGGDTGFLLTLANQLPNYKHNI